MKSLTKSGLRAVPDSQFQISLAMHGVLRDVEHALVGLCVRAGKQVLAAMMEADRAALCGLKGVPDAARRAVRGGTTRSKVVLGGQRIDIGRPRARELDVEELQLPSFTWAANVDPLNTATMAAIAAGVSTRRYAKTVDQLPPDELSSATSSSAVSRRFVALSQQQLDEWLKRKLDTLDLPVVMIEGIYFCDSVILVSWFFTIVRVMLSPVKFCPTRSCSSLARTRRSASCASTRRRALGCFDFVLLLLDLPDAAFTDFRRRHPDVEQSRCENKCHGCKHPVDKECLMQREFSFRNLQCVQDGRREGEQANSRRRLRIGAASTSGNP
jgi:hypothetical protein